MFLLKKIIGPLLLPLSLCLEILLLGIFLLWFTRKQKAGKIAVTTGIVLLVVFSYGGISDVCLRPLEYKYSPLMDFQAFSDVKWVVVLGGGHISDPKLPVTAQIGDSSLFRLLEGIRIHRKLPGTRLILSGSGVYDPVSDAKIMADVSYISGINNDKLILEELSKDTKDQARLIYEIVGHERFILVTSASHMPRAICLFQKLGMLPIPAPTDYLVKERQGISPGVFFPNTGSLHKMERSFYEYLGLAWAKLMGQI